MGMKTSTGVAALTSSHPRMLDGARPPLNANFPSLNEIEQQTLHGVGNATRRQLKTSNFCASRPWRIRHNHINLQTEGRWARARQGKLLQPRCGGLNSYCLDKSTKCVRTRSGEIGGQLRLTGPACQEPFSTLSHIIMQRCALNGLGS